MSRFDDRLENLGAQIEVRLTGSTAEERQDFLDRLDGEMTYLAENTTGLETIASLVGAILSQLS